MNNQQTYQEKLISAGEAAKLIQSGDNIFVSPLVSPFAILDALTSIYETVQDVDLFSTFLMKPYPWLTDPSYQGHIRYNCFFVGPLERQVVAARQIRINSVHFSETKRYFHDVYQPNVSLMAVSPMDEEGYMYFGPLGVATNQVVLDQTNLKIVEINQEMPKNNGIDAKVHISEIDYVVEGGNFVPSIPEAPSSEMDKKIADHIVPLVRDGSTIQVGIGGLGNAVSYGLEGKKNLSVHTEMITESMMHLIKVGTISEKVVGGFVLGSRELFDFTVANEQVSLAPLHIVNHRDEIAKNDNFVSINSCLMTDLTGQIASEGIGTRMVSSTGGAADFVNGATRFKGGQSFICLNSTNETADGQVTSNIVLALPPSTPVTIQRSDVQYVVTEYGVANLYDRSIPERVEALIGIAHPDFREELRKQALEAGFINPPVKVSVK